MYTGKYSDLNPRVVEISQGEGAWTVLYSDGSKKILPMDRITPESSDIKRDVKNFEWHCIDQMEQARNIRRADIFQMKAVNQSSAIGLSFE